MTSKDRLTQELKNLPDQLIDQVLDYITFIKYRHFLFLLSPLGNLSMGRQKVRIPHATARL
ncbi:hypothetical protein L2E81_14400 [Planktothrix agardhii 1033]|nr:hypothetical protein [Planktothrix agardhii 1033]